MFRRLLALDDFEARGALMRRLHSLWLTRAMKHGSRSVPRIPTRLVSEGGFAPIMATREGREWAESFWNDTLGEGLDD